MFTKMLMLMPSTPVVLLAIAVLAVLVILTWFVGGTAPNRRVAPRAGADSRKGYEASSIKNAASMKQAA
jgi:hypothetical protein